MTVKPYQVRCYREDYCMVLELGHRAWGHAVAEADNRRRHGNYKEVVICKVRGLSHNDPMKWRWSCQDQAWKPFAWFNELAAGKRTPSARKAPPSLFSQEQTAC